MPFSPRADDVSQCICKRPNATLQLQTNYRCWPVVSELASICEERNNFGVHEIVYSLAKVGFVFLMPANMAFFTSSDWIMPMLYAAT
jgi:hypothetical protein